MLLSGGIEFQRTESKMASLDTLVDQVGREGGRAGGRDGGREREKGSSIMTSFS